MSSPNWFSEENVNPSTYSNNVKTIPQTVTNHQELTPDEEEILPQLSNMFNQLEVSLVLNTLRANHCNPEACVEQLLILNLVHEEENKKDVLLEEVESRNAEEVLVQKPETVIDSVDNSQNAEETPMLSVCDTLCGNGNLHCNPSNAAIFEPVQGEREQSEAVVSELDPMIDYYSKVPSAYEVHRDWRSERMRKLELKKEKKRAQGFRKTKETTRQKTKAPGKEAKEIREETPTRSPSSSSSREDCQA